MAIDGILLKRKEIGNCRHCNKSPDGVEFHGSFNCYGTHLKSKCGWWLRVDHSMGWGNEPRGDDKVGELLCSVCGPKEAERVAEIMGL